MSKEQNIPSKRTIKSIFSAAVEFIDNLFSGTRSYYKFSLPKSKEASTFKFSQKIAKNITCLFCNCLDIRRTCVRFGQTYSYKTEIIFQPKSTYKNKINDTGKFQGIFSSKRKQDLRRLYFVGIMHCRRFYLENVEAGFWFKLIIKFFFTRYFFFFLIEVPICVFLASMAFYRNLHFI